MPHSCSHSRWCFSKFILIRQLTRNGFRELISTRTLRLLRVGELSDDLALPHARHLTVVAKGREHLYVTEVLTRRFELLWRLAYFLA